MFDHLFDETADARRPGDPARHERLRRASERLRESGAALRALSREIRSASQELDQLTRARFGGARRFRGKA